MFYSLYDIFASLTRQTTDSRARVADGLDESSAESSAARPSSIAHSRAEAHGTPSRILHLSSHHLHRSAACSALFAFPAHPFFLWPCAASAIAAVVPSRVECSPCRCLVPSLESSRVESRLARRWTAQREFKPAAAVVKSRAHTHLCTALTQTAMSRQTTLTAFVGAQTAAAAAAADEQATPASAAHSRPTRVRTPAHPQPAAAAAAASSKPKPSKKGKTAVKEEPTEAESSSAAAAAPAADSSSAAAASSMADAASECEEEEEVETAGDSSHCGVCEGRGELLLCDGPCGRSAQPAQHSGERLIAVESSLPLHRAVLCSCAEHSMQHACLSAPIPRIRSSGSVWSAETRSMNASSAIRRGRTTRVGPQRAQPLHTAQLDRRSCSLSVLCSCPAEVFLCSIAVCGKFYHKECVASVSLIALTALLSSLSAHLLLLAHSSFYMCVRLQ